MLTLAIIKPDAVKRGLAGKIVAHLEAAGFAVRAARLVKLSTAQAEAFYEVHRERPFYRSLVTFMTSGPGLALTLERDDAVTRLREVIGATDPAEAKPGTVRQLYAESKLAGIDPLFEGLDVVLADPVHVAGRLHAAGEGRFYWRGSLHTRMAGQCRRCLVPVPVPVVAEIDALFSADPDALEDPSSYPLVPDATEIDLRPAVREELLLAVPRW